MTVCLNFQFKKKSLNGFQTIYCCFFFSVWLRLSLKVADNIWVRFGSGSTKNWWFASGFQFSSVATPWFLHNNL